MGCSWIEKVKQKHQEKNTKYAPLTWEIKQQYRDYTINQYNIIIDVLGEYLSESKQNVRSLLGSSRANKILNNMQRAVLTSTMNIGRTFQFV